MVAQGTVIVRSKWGDAVSFALHDDALDHDLLARAITGHLDVLPPGSVVALQGAWGRGKTDVLHRVRARFDQRAIEGKGPKPLTLDPWRYGTPNLISPVVQEIVRRIPPARRKNDVMLAQCAKSLLRAGNVLLFKTLPVLMPPPLGAALDSFEQPVDHLLARLFSSGASSEPEDLDPVHVMAERFADLVAHYLRAVSDGRGRLLVCVDDLDRCLPDHQIAMLEAIHFLTSTDAECSFLIAIDPVLVQQAAITHYKTDGFDFDQYLNKLFNLRVTLPELRVGAVEGLIAAELGRRGEAALPGLGTTVADVAAELSRVMWLPDLKNPRMIYRVCERIHLLELAGNSRLMPDSGQDHWVRGVSDLRAVVLWSVITERWAQLRQILQDLQPSPKAWLDCINAIRYEYGLAHAFYPSLARQEREEMVREYTNVFARLPARERQRDLGEFLGILAEGGPELIDRLMAVDAVMNQFGL